MVEPAEDEGNESISSVGVVMLAYDDEGSDMAAEAVAGMRIDREGWRWWMAKVGVLGLAMSPQVRGSFQF